MSPQGSAEPNKQKQKLDAQEPQHTQLPRQGFISYFTRCIKQEWERHDSFWRDSLTASALQQVNIKAKQYYWEQENTTRFRSSKKVKDVQPRVKLKHPLVRQNHVV